MDVLQIPSDKEDKKLFVICEMNSSDSIEAKINYTGSANGELPQNLGMPDTFSFSITEGDKDFGVPFRFDPKKELFFIEQNQLPLIAGIRYKLRGVGNNVNASEPSVIFPDPVTIDTVIFEDILSYFENGKYTTEVKCSLKIKKTNNQPLYLMVVPITKFGQVWAVTKFEKNHGAYKRLIHRSGFLIDYAQITNDELNMTLSVSGDMEVKNVQFYVSNVNTSFYQYNNYITNLTSDPGQSTQIPAIAGFNIKTDKAYGTFSARNTTQKSFIIR